MEIVGTVSILTGGLMGYSTVPIADRLGPRYMDFSRKRGVLNVHLFSISCHYNLQDQFVCVDVNYQLRVQASPNTRASDNY